MGIHDGPPAGWHAMDGLLIADMTVRGYIARGTEVVGVCHTQDCRRRYVVNLKELMRRGFDRAHIGVITQYAKCQRIEGCNMQFGRADVPLEVPLASLTGRSHVRIRIRCGTYKCTFLRVYTVDQMIKEIRAREQGGDLTLVCEIPGKLKKPCTACGRRDWRADVLWANTDSAGWKVRGEAVFNGG